MKNPSRVLRLVAAALALWLTGCGSSPLPRLYVLSPLEPAAAPGNPAGPGAAEAGIGIGIGPVSVAPHLDRPQIVSRQGSELHLTDYERWGEPLADGVARTLAENLSRLLGTDRVWLHPWPPGLPVDLQVAVDVLRFDDEGGEAVLAARYTLTDAGGLRATRRFERREPAESGRAAVVEALSRGLAELSREIAAAIGETTAAER